MQVEKCGTLSFAMSLPPRANPLTKIAREDYSRFAAAIIA
jgi:hypothetical protein